MREGYGAEWSFRSFIGQLSNNWLPLLLARWPNSPPWFSARPRIELFISTLGTIGLVYRLSPTFSNRPIDPPSATSVMNYSLGNHAERLTSHREHSAAITSTTIQFIIPLHVSQDICPPFFFIPFSSERLCFFSPLLLPPPSSSSFFLLFVRPRLHKVAFICHAKFRDHVIIF